jgi:hypothetical protein
VETTKKRFEGWDVPVDCNDCEKYWDGSCDGVCKAQERHCTAFKATRSVVIPEQIKSLRTRLKWLTGAFAVLSVIQLATLVLLFL